MKGKHIVVGITGGIAAYKSASLVRLFVKAGAEVQVIMTPNAKEFITPVTLSTLSGHPVISEFFTANTGQWNSHVDLGLWADAMVIAPATASSIGKMANGVADNMLVTSYLSTRAEVFIAPAMDFDIILPQPATWNYCEVTGTTSSNLPQANWLHTWLGKDAWKNLKKFLRRLKTSSIKISQCKGNVYS